MNKLLTTPNTWQSIKVEDISLRIHYGYTAGSIKKNTGTKLLRITDIQEYKVIWDNVPYCEIKSTDIEKYLLKENDIVFARTGATVGKSFLIQGKIPQSVFASYLIRIQLSTKINPQYIFYFFQSADYWKQIGMKAVGSGQPNVNAASLSKISLMLCSKTEQNKIVNAIEEQFSKIEKGEELLLLSLKQLSIYRQSILEFAFKHNNDKDDKTKISSVKYTKIKLNDVLSFVGSGTTPKGGQNVYKSSGVMFLRSQNIYANKLKLDNVAYISEEIDEKMHRTRVKSLDVLLNITGASIGRCSYVPVNFPAANVNQHVCILRSNQEVLHSVFLSNYLNSPKAQREIMNIQSGATRQGLNFKQIRNIEIPLPSIDEQKNIVSELESRTTICDKIEEIISNTLQECKSLKQSILKKAFSGELLPNDFNNTSTNQLLSEIQTEKKAFLDKVTEIKYIDKSLKVTKLNMSEEPKQILDILGESDEPQLTKNIWLSSVYKDDIEGFYAALKKHIENGDIIEMPRNNKETSLKLANVK